jgi:acetyl esterase/lipase
MSALMTPADYTALPLVGGDYRIAYGALDDQFGELFLPESSTGDPAPLAVLLHGGCWRARFGLAPLGQLARRLAERGIAVWNVEFRRLDGGGGWPHTFLDVAAAADFVRTLADEYPISPERVLAIGHSAGGHLACWLAQRHQLTPDMTLYQENPLPLVGIVSLAGIPDLEKATDTGICAGAPVELMGGDNTTVPARYREGSPHAGPPLKIPQWHVVGEDDTLVPASYVEDAVAFAHRRGEVVELITVPAAGHFEIVSASSPAWPMVEATIDAALR